MGLSNDISLLWTPGYQDLHGSKCADILAKQGSVQELIGPGPTIPLAMSTIKEEISSWCFAQHRNLWNSLETCQNSKLLIKEPLNKDYKWIINLSKTQQRKLIGVITGHCALKDHLFTIGLSTDRLCRFCQADAESAYHVICLCPSFTVPRLQMFNLDYISENRYASR